MPKKSQVSIFFLIALVIMISGGIYFYFQRITIEEAEAIRPELAPIQAFIGSCIDQTATEASIILGLNGGYIDFPLSIEANPRSYLRSGPLEEIKNPYWWHDGISGIPSEEFMVQQLEDYINNHLGACLNNFEAFSSQFQVEELGPINTKVTLADSDVAVDVDFPIDVLKKENTTRIRFEKFSETVPIRLKKAYEFAKKIMEAENRDNFLEKKTMDLIVLDREIPTTDVEATCQQRIWNLNDVSSKLKQLLRANLPYIRILGSSYADNVFVPNPFGEDTYKDSYFQSHYVWEVSDEKFPDFNTAFTFNENWPFNLQARPRDGNLLKSNSQKGFDVLSFFCLHIWHFTYDVSYPVRVTVTDADQGSRPYAFSFAFKVNIDHNQPNRQNLGTTIFETVERPESEEFCNDVSNEIVIYTIRNTTEGQTDLADVDMTLTCGPYTCDLGKTDWLSFGAASGMIKQMPYCVNAILRGKKQGFLDAQAFIQTDRPRAYTLHMKPVKEFSNYKVVKHQLANPSLQSPLSENEKASIQIIKIGGSFETFGVYPTEEAFPINLLEDEATYDLTIYLTDNEKILGGYKQKWAVNPEELRDANEIVFHVLEQGIVLDDERALFLAGLESYSQQIPKPELKQK